MTTINLKDFYYWYTQDQFIEVTEEVAEALRASVRYEAAYQRRLTRHKAQYSLDCEDGIEYSACLHEPTPQEVLELKERFIRLWNALNSLPEIQGRRIDAHIILGKFLEAGLRENLKNVVAQNCRLGILVLFEQVIPKYMDLADQYNLEMTVLQRSIPVTALMSKSHPLANSSRVSLKDLTGYPFIADAHIDPDDTLDVLGLQSHTDLLYICDRGTIFDAVRKGNYIAIGISIPEEDARRMNCVCCPIADGAPMAVALLHSRTFTLRPREKHFIRYLTDRLHKRYSG